MKESGKECLKSTIYESTLSTANAVPLPQWGRLRGATLRVDFCKGAMPEVGKQSPATQNHSFLLSNYGVQRVQKVLRVQVAALPQYKSGDARRFAMAGFPRIAAPLQGRLLS